MAVEALAEAGAAAVMAPLLLVTQVRQILTTASLSTVARQPPAGCWLMPSTGVRPEARQRERASARLREESVSFLPPVVEMAERMAAAEALREAAVEGVSTL